MLLKEVCKEDIILERAYCHITKGCYKAKLLLKVNLLPFLPYLRARVKVLYFEPNEILVFKWFKSEKTYNVAINNNTLAVEIVEDREEALEIFKEIINFVNLTWEERNQIVPNIKPVKRPPVLEIYKHLPKTNCKACGEETCLAFATKLVIAEKEVDECPEIVKDPELLQFFKVLVE